jgi:hypothetical protein
VDPVALTHSLGLLPDPENVVHLDGVIEVKTVHQLDAPWRVQIHPELVRTRLAGDETFTRQV